MNHPRKPFKLDLMTALLIVVSLGVLLTMIAQAGETSTSDQVAVYQTVQASTDTLTPGLR